METRNLPDYAVFDDYRHYVRIAVLVRWLVLAVWFVLQNTRVVETNTTFYTNNTLAAGLAVLNGYVGWRIWTGRSVARSHALVLSVMDLVFITLGVFTTTGFGNPFFVLYYPALLTMAIVFPSRLFSFGVVTLVAIAYALLSSVTEPGVSFDFRQDKVLIIRIVTMFAVVGAASLMHRVERTRRRAAVEAEKVQSERNLELQRKAQEVELAAQEERSRIAREIHDGISQSIYALSLSLETCADLAERDQGPLKEQLQRLVPMAKKALLETRYYIHDLKPLLEDERDLVTVANSQVREFQMVAGTPTNLSVTGEPHETPVLVATSMYRILQEALANVLKHARASTVDVALGFERERVRLTVHDDGVGFDADGKGRGYGLDNMRERAEEMGGTFELSSDPGRGTSVSVVLPIDEEG